MVKPKRCRTCRSEFVPRLSTQVCCSSHCAILYARHNGAHREIATRKVRAAERAERREQKRKSIPLSKLKSQAQHEFNCYIRERDFGQPCISCGRNTGSKMNAGHYRTTKAAPHLRYDERACFLQCEHCNTYLSGNQIEYRKALVARFGREYVEDLERDSLALKWSRDELIGIRKHYLGKWKALRAARESK